MIIAHFILISKTNQTINQTIQLISTSLLILTNIFLQYEQVYF